MSYFARSETQKPNEISSSQAILKSPNASNTHLNETTLPIPTLQKLKERLSRHQKPSMTKEPISRVIDKLNSNTIPQEEIP